MNNRASRIKWGLIGCGDISSKRVAPALRDSEGCLFTAANRSDFSKLPPFADEFGVELRFKTWQELVQSPEVEAVYVATPVDLHAPITIAAAESGKHVLCEKPMALDVGQCDRMIEACRQNNVKLGIAYYRRFYPVLRRIREVIDSGEIGRPMVAQLNAFEFYNPIAGDPRFWFVQKDRAGGGPMFDFGCHRIEALINLFGTVRKERGLLSCLRFEREVEDTAVAHLLFESGTQATITVTHTTWEPQDTLRIFGTEGSINVSVLNSGDLEIASSRGTRREAWPPHPNFHQPLIEDFNDAVLSNRDPGITGTVGREVNRILDQVCRTAF
ncbi:MAG: Gfo/Idh/MocA family oxidoreductase [Acidobacteriota bacterium]|nr:MAG: Gfo/Idh/MocA family oxidoreductase [Acidobacteriota bacterium]